MSLLYRHTEVLSREADDEAHIAMTVRAEQAQRDLVMRRFAGRVEEVALCGLYVRSADLRPDLA